LWQVVNQSTKAGWMGSTDKYYFTAILTEGTDLPRVDCILLARKTGSEPLFQQMLGRGSRLHDEKQDCLVVDFRENFERLFDGMMASQDELDEKINNKKKVVKKTSTKNASKADLDGDKYGL